MYYYPCCQVVKLKWYASCLVQDDMIQGNFDPHQESIRGIQNLYDTTPVRYNTVSRTSTSFFSETNLTIAHSSLNSPIIFKTSYVHTAYNKLSSLLECSPNLSNSLSQNLSPQVWERRRVSVRSVKVNCKNFSHLIS